MIIPICVDIFDIAVIGTPKLQFILLIVTFYLLLYPTYPFYFLYL